MVKHPSAGYAIAVLASGLALAFSLLTSPAIRPYAFPELFLAAVAVSAWWGGLGAGLVATILSAGATVYLFLPAFRSLAPASVGSIVQLGIFVLIALLVSTFRRSLRAAGQAAEANARAAEERQRRLAFLAEASSALGASLDYEATLRAVVRLAVPFLADYCAVDILDADGAIRRLALQHVNPEREALARDLTARYPLDPGGPHPIVRVLRTGEPEIVPEIPDSLIALVARDAEHLALLRRFGVTSGMCAPLVARGRTLGAISFMVSESIRRYGEDDLALAEDVARRCAAAIDHARLYQEAQEEIAERTRAEARLRESQERLNLAVEAAHMGTWDWNLATGEVRIDWADSFEAMHLPQPTFVGSYDTFFRHVHPEDRQRVRDALDVALRDGSDYEIELRALWPDGSVRWIACLGKAVRDEHGTPVRLIGVPVDITERKRAEQRLAIQYATTRVLAESATLEEAAPGILRTICESLGWIHGALWRVSAPEDVLRCVEIWHPSHVDVAAFEAVSRATVFQPGIGLPGRVWKSGEPAWIPDVVPDANFPRAAVAARDGLHAALGFPVKSGSEVLGVLEFFNRRIVPPDEALLAMLATVGAQIGQFMQRTRAEEERARLLARVQTAHAEARGAERRAAFLADASSALSASLEYPAILESVAHLAVPYLADWCTVDVRGEDGSVERAVAHADPAKAELLRSLVRRYPPPASHPLRQAVRAGRALLLPVVTRDDEVVGVAQEDEHRDLARRLEIRSFMLIPLVARGRTLGAIALGSATPGRYGPADLSLGEDLARRAALAIDNARLYHDAQEAARRKDEFLAMLGHELRNPLAAIRGATQVLDRISSQIEPAVRQRAIIDRQTRHLARLVDDLLDVSRVVSGKIALQLEAVELNELALRCMQALQQRVEAQGPEMRFTAADAPVVVRGDPVRLEQVVSNLLDNAVKYTPADGRIELSVERVDGEAVVRVRDSGVGIAPELLPRVFDLFTQAERSLDRAQGGLGLGLTLVRRLVEQHGGSVAATSAGAGRGSEFLVSLPVLHERGDGAPAAEVQSAAPAGARHVLLIDDNADAREALRALLELWGHRVDVADDGPSGIELGRRLRPEVALVDIGLPGVDGYQVAAALRASEETRIQLVAITGYGQPEDRLRALEAGFDAHLVKPVDLDELARVLARPTATEAPGASRKLVSAGS